MDKAEIQVATEDSPAPGSEGVLYVVATVHLDTQWRWTVQRTIDEYLPATLDGNFELFEKYPHYVLSWEGAFRYMLIQEYYPEQWKKLLEYARDGRWTVAGNMLESVDVNLISPESLIRQFLYGSRFFERELRAQPIDIFLPDCFGFGFSFPSIAAHCGLKGFSSQKFIKWIAPSKTPFDIGVWEGPDGASLLAALHPEGYGDGIDEDLSRAERWRERLGRYKEETGAALGYKYFGIGDRGGAPDEESLEWLAKSLHDPGPIEIVHAKSDRFFRELEAHRDRLPRHRGELLLPVHGPGCYTSLASMKRMNRKNEILADSAERAATIAAWLGALAYPEDSLREGWHRFLWHQMHDDLTGTSIPQAYTFSWNDEAIALNRFGGVLTDAVETLAEGLDTAVDGVPLVVFNSLSIERQDIVEATVEFSGETPPSAVRVFGPDGSEAPSQFTRAKEGQFNVVFLADLPPVGCAVYDVRPSESGCGLRTGLRASADKLENDHYRVEVNDAGDISRIYAKQLDHELLSAPLGLELLPDSSSKFPAWELPYKDISADPEPVRRRLSLRVIESGPARTTLEVRRAARGSTLVQRIRLAAGDAGCRIEIDNLMEWRTWGRLLKAAFPIAVEQPKATYDLGLGVVERGVNRPESFEVPAQQWADLSAGDGSRGVSILSDCKYGWDRPAAGRLRLTLVRSPWAARGHPHQATQDWGHHRFGYAIYGHAGDWSGGTAWQAGRFNEPPIAFQIKEESGARAPKRRLGDMANARRFSFVEIDSPAVALRALKKAEDTDEWIVRLQELSGEPKPDVGVRFPTAVVAAREVNGIERGDELATVRDGALQIDFGRFAPKTFAIELAAPEALRTPAITTALRLPFDARATSFDGGPPADFDGRGRSIPGELFPERLHSGGIEFELGPNDGEASNCVTCRGQQIPLPAGDFERLFLIAASIKGELDGVFQILGQELSVRVAPYDALIGEASHRPAIGRVRYGAARPGFLRPDRIAWTATHRHQKDGSNEAYAFCHLFHYALDLPQRSGTSVAVLELPDEPRLRLFAVTLGRELPQALRPARPLFK